jgi:cell division transport system permease protein
MALRYSFRYAFQSLCREKWINLLSILTVASSLLIIILTVFFLYNIEIIANRLPERFSIVVYLKDTLLPEETQAIMSDLKKIDAVSELRYISKENALNEIKQTLKDTSYILEGLNENPLSASIELKLKKDFVTSPSVKKIAAEIKKIAGVDDVYYGEKVAEAIHLIKRSIQNISIIIFMTISAGVVFVTYSTVKILFYRRNEEIEIIKLLGATKGFIRRPFLIEGGSIGFFGGILSSLGALLFYLAITYRLSSVIPMLKTLVFPVESLIAMPAIGIVLGIIGSIIAIGRLKL